MTRRDWHNLPEHTRDAAIAWHVRLTSDDADDAVYEAFAVWLAEDENNIAAIDAVEGFASRFEYWRRADHSGLERLIDHSPRAGGFGGMFADRRLVASAAALFVAVTGGLLWHSSKYWIPERETVTASNQGVYAVTLDDGTEVSLAPGGEIKTAFSASVRRVSELRGVAFFHVAHDQNRPFKIAFGDKTITVVGTQFEVSVTDAQRSVAVAKGVVAVAANAAKTEAPAVELTAGKRLKITDASPDGVIDKVDASSVGNWRAGFLEFDGAALREVVDRLNAIYGESTFAIHDQGAGQLRFSGILQLSNPGDIARRMGELMPVTVTKTESGFDVALNAAPKE